MKQKVGYTIGTFRQELFRLVNDWRVYVSILLYVVVCILSIREFTIDSVTTAYNMIIGLSNMDKLLILIAAFPFASSFCEDLSHNNIRSIIIRCGSKRYLMIKMITCIVTAFFISLIGMILFSLVLLFVYPLDRGYLDDIYSILLQGKFPYVYVVIRAGFFSLVIAIWAAFGIAISAILPNKFVATLAPLLINFVIENLTGTYLPYLYTHRLQGGTGPVRTTMGMNFVFIVCIELGYLLIAWLIFHSFAGRRIRNEIV